MVIMAGLFAVSACTGFAQESAKPDTAEPDTIKKIITSISITPDGIVIEGKTSGEGPDSVTVIDIGDIKRTHARALEEQERLSEEMKRLQDLDIVEYDAEGHDIVRFGENIRIRRDKRIRGSVVAIGGSIVIEGHVVGDVVSVGGNVELEPGATVTGDAVAVGGSLDLNAGCIVRGDAVSVGGKIIEREGSRVSGDTVSVGFIPAFFFKGFRSPFAHRAMDITGYAVKSLIVLLFAWAAAAIFPGRVKNMVDYAGSSVWLSAVVGFAVVIAMPIVVLLLIVTLIGIPLAVILPIVFAVASVVAYAVGAGLLGYRFGSKLVSKTPRELSLAQAVLLGVLIVAVVRLSGKLLGLSSELLWPLSAALSAAGLLAGFFIYLSGLGSLLLTRFGSKQQPPAVQAASPPPAPSTGPGGPPQGGTGPGGAPPQGEPPRTQS